MNTVFHSANSRGNANHGWLKSRHTFSFANYYDPNRIHFGALRVINDDYVEGAMGFGTHPHDNMEIISIPLSGDLAHKDSMGNGGVIRQGDIQVMFAGTGITHREMNPNADMPVQFLQIWVFPNQRNVAPRYQQMRIVEGERRNDFQQILSPNADDEGVWIHQDAWFSLAKFDQGTSKIYDLHKAGNGVYAFVLKGNATIAGKQLSSRDGLGIWDTASFDVVADSDTEILLMEVPMVLPQ
ncbi:MULTISPECIES: pirin family protein [unclassified Avibacterium]|uniref:pirin family protein n=1 Tax=unclassified Avibacterium TaxID=2685287 RepID=UPI002187D571|nr:pirin family protein [Avibacterium sp. 20-129]MCW9698672.1 pirin family protein [Avibacterium sp. 20-129]URL02433.1 pirin family protein [Avibacterium sp. 20-126]